MANLKLDFDDSLDRRIAAFKSDPDKMNDVNDFLNELFEKAKTEVQLRQSKQKNKFDALGIQSEHPERRKECCSTM